MTFRDDIDSEFDDLIKGEFSLQVVVAQDGVDHTTRGIWDETYEPIETENATSHAALFSRVTITKRDLEISPKRNDRVRIYVDGEDEEPRRFRVHDPQGESEGNLMLVLIEEIVDDDGDNES